jgi:hypothetical protein
MIVEEQRRVLDEHRIRIVGQLWKAYDLESGAGQSPLVG